MHLVPGRRRGVLVTSLVALAAATSVAVAPPASAGFQQPTVVSSTPVSYTPNLKTGYIIHDQTVVNGIVYSGGQFTQFENAARTITYNRNNLVAYSASTGAVQPLSLTFNGDVQAVLGSPDGSSL